MMLNTYREQYNICMNYGMKHLPLKDNHIVRKTYTGLYRILSEYHPTATNLLQLVLGHLVGAIKVVVCLFKHFHNRHFNHT